MVRLEHESRCPLCGGCDINHFHKDSCRIYLRCFGCFLVFVPEQYWLLPEEDKKVYDLHQNDSHQTGYRQFLSRLSLPLLERLGQGSFHGLDFGCGPGPVLAKMLTEQGHRVDLYDPYYFPDGGLLAKRYDFICATEVIEHLRKPAFEFERLFSLLKPCGWLGIMTKLVHNQEAFTRWHYIRDETHICFFSRPVFHYMADKYGTAVEFAADDVILLCKGLQENHEK